METIEHKICGIPCQLQVVHFLKVKPCAWADNPDDYYGFEECEYNVLDRRGRAAPWLEKKMDDKEREKAENVIAERMGERDYDGDDGSYDGDY
jgi:hypothetical protein